MKKNVLVFPCGSEIGLEIYRSVRYSTHFNLIGANSVPDHGAYVYEEYVEGVPFIDQPGFIEKLNSIIIRYNIHLLYPTMDSVITKIWQLRDQLLCDIVGSPGITNSICLSKKTTTELLSRRVAMPEIFNEISSIKEFPVFLKPEIGYSARGTATAFTKDEVTYHLMKQPGCLVMEYLPGEEYTTDCFTDRNRKLVFAGTRLRSRISNGISVNTVEAAQKETVELKTFATIINQQMLFRGAWFFQVKRAGTGELKVMEVAARLGGSSALFRAKGINFAMLSLWDALNIDVAIIENRCKIAMDRALDNKFKIEIDYQKVYVDFDDTLIINQKINIEMISFLYQCKNEQKEIICISRHDGDLNEKLLSYGLDHLFDKVIHLRDKEPKERFIEKPAIFIDDSYAERENVANTLGIPVFSPDMIAALLK